MESSPRRRRQSSSASYKPQLSAEIIPLLESLEVSAAEPDLLVRLQCLSLLRRILIDSPAAKDSFRNLKGFNYLIDTLNSLAGYYDEKERTEEEKRCFIELIKCLFGVVSEALVDHIGNKRFFARKIGYHALQQGLAATGIPVTARDQLFGILLSFAMDDAALSSFMQLVSAGMPSKREDRLAHIRAKVKGLFSTDDTVKIPEVIPIILDFQMALPADEDSEIASIAVIQALAVIVKSSKYNQAVVHETGILSTIIPRLWDSGLPQAERAVLLGLAERLIELGISGLEDAKYLYRNAMEIDAVANFLLKAIKSSQAPPHIQFDLSRHGYSSMELPSLGRTFPPSTSGYTFSAWICIDQFDSTMHTTIFGIFDSTQRCFVLAYIEQDTRKFILQTSVAAPRASVRFKTIVFERGRWYHVALAHRRGRGLSAAKAALYIDGEFVEQVKCAYPQSPPTENQPVQLFLGTPSQLSPRLGSGVVSSKWSLGTAHLFDDILSDDLIAVHYRLGPRYFGNFQDCLGSFQTYEASAALNMRNELMHPGREEKSDIISAIRHKASGILPETKILLSISATSILDDNSNNAIDEGQLVKSLSKKSAVSLSAWVRSGAVAINGAVPSINEALCAAHGVAIMTGGPIVVVPQSLDDASWRIGGCAAVGLKMVEMAKTSKQVCRAVDILFEMIKGSWRNSEAMEKDNGFGILANLLRTKEAKGIIGAELLNLVLEFVGYNSECPEESIIINPLAYRILLVDFDMWRKADIDTQRRYFAQFVTFGQGSKYHHFNSKRLFRMRIVKKLLLALKAEIFSPETLPDFMQAFKAIVKTNMSADVLRSLSLFITYSLHKHNPSRPLKVKKSNVQLKRQGTALTDTGSASNGGTGYELKKDEASRQQIGVMVLKMYAELLCDDDPSAVNIKKFARTVTNKWLLYLLAENDTAVVILGAKILARLLVVHGRNYVNKFAAKTGGFIIMKQRLKRWWRVAPLWPILFAILFGVDVAKVDIERPLDLFHLVETFRQDGKATVGYPEIFPVIAGMLKAGVGVILKVQGDGKTNESNETEDSAKSRSRSLSVNDQTANKEPQNIGDMVKSIQTVIQFCEDMHSKCSSVREFCANSSFLQDLFTILFPVVVSSDAVSAETELKARDSALTFDGGDVMIRSLSMTPNTAPPIVRTVTIQDTEAHIGSTSASRQSSTLRRASSFVLVTSEQTPFSPSSARLASTLNSPAFKFADLAITNGVVESLLELVVAVFVDSVMERREFSGFNLFTKIPPGFQEHQIYFESYLLRNTLSHLNNMISLNMKLLCEPRVLTNIGRYMSIMTDSVYEGWFLGGAEPLLDFVGAILEYLQRPDVAKQKSVRLCSQSLASLRSTVGRLVLFRLSEIDDMAIDEKQALTFLNKIMYWQAIILSPENTEGEFTRLICYLLYSRLIDDRQSIRLAAADIMRIVLVQKPIETSIILNQSKSIDHKIVSSGFQSLMELDNETFIDWTDDHRKELDELFYGALSKTWEAFVAEQNKKCEESGKFRLVKRREKLKQWIIEDMNSDDVYSRHDLASNHWMANIYAAEHLKHQRANQDQQDNLNFIVSLWSKIEADLTRPCGLLDNGEETKWRLDLTEGRNRMRKRMLPDATSHLHNYQPKRRLTDGPTATTSSSSSRQHTLSVGDDEISIINRETGADSPEQSHQNSGRDGGDDDFDDDYELVEDPRGDDDDSFEDKNRKVMRSIQHGDVVEDVHNVSRLVGLSPCEGLLILGKNCLYIIDNFFQRSDGEIVNVWQAPQDERDQYLQLIAGREAEEKKTVESDHETRHWPFEELTSISKRRFLFRDVALELFFTDGRSYLLTTMSVKDRNTIHSKLTAKATNASANPVSPHMEDAWRVESLKTQDFPGSNFGLKFANVFNSAGAPNPATKKWLKGEISNFHYLMLVNTMAGRTFNDLTQYPVFPWVLADYTSDELDLNDPKTFRDFSKPMGCQTAERQREFRERYRSFEELGDAAHVPFHYGTHYSSAMIVCSYLIRLQPFVESYLLLQGGQFDHADRLFYSIEKAWASASRENMSDVRELVPEFFYLPEFLVNANSYNFGVKQGSSEAIDSVILPPWAKGDPKIFIQKHREALESPYVSQHLHEWIDLIFGYKQRGDAAVEATNVFHHLSYHGAIDLDAIEDPVERVASIGIIHNFGQTPHQVFTRTHLKKDELGPRTARLDVAVETLIRLPFPVLENGERVHSLVYSAKTERIIASAGFRLTIPPKHEKYMEWGFTDDSIRFYHADGKKQCGHFEHPHQSQISAAVFSDLKTLITAGNDGTITVWQLTVTSKAVDIQPKMCLFGHTSAINVMAVSRSFTTLVSASNENALVWDLNRLRFVRKLKANRGPVQCVAVNDISGDIILCAGAFVQLFTLNGEHILTQNVCETSDDVVVSCAFYEGSGNEWLEKELVLTGHRRGVVKIWQKSISNLAGSNKFCLSLLKTLQHTNQFQSDVGVVQTSITAILPMNAAVYTGDDSGRVYEWDCQAVDRNSRAHAHGGRR